MQHTPGPWIWGDDDYRGLYGAGKDSEVLDHAPYEGMWLNHGPNRKADAALLAASPSMAAVLDLIVRRLQADIDDGSRPDQRSMEYLVRKAKEVLPAGWAVGAA